MNSTTVTMIDINMTNAGEMTDVYDSVHLEDPDSLYTSTQRQTLQIMSVVTGSLSVVGSCWIIYQILTTPPQSPGRRRSSAATTNQKRAPPSLAALKQSVYLRLLMGLSALDLLSSIGSAGFSNWAIAPEVDYVYNPTGSWNATDVGGFFTNFMVGTTVYSGYLAIYFVLLVRYEVREEWMAKFAEPVVHAHAILFPLVTGLVALVKHWFGPINLAPGTIWLDAYPFGCWLPDSEIECTRKANEFVMLLCGAINITGALLIMTVSMCMLIGKVRQTELQMKQYAGTQAQDEPLVLTRRTTIQAMLYIGVYFLTYFGFVAIQILAQGVRIPETSEYRSLWFGFAMVAKIFTPLQGALNAFVFWYRTVDGKTGNKKSQGDAAGSKVKSQITNATAGSSIQVGDSLRESSHRYQSSQHV